jgi:DNA (cytosine-5)-methyltransferase 1
MGLHRAGFDVVGIDIKPQPRFPFTFICADALNPPVQLEDFDLIWASPPCQAFSSSKTHNYYPNLIPQVRQMVCGHPTVVIENVPQAPLRKDLVLNGAMFSELRVVRKRIFETTFPIPPLQGKPPKGAVSHLGWCCVVGTGRPSGLPKKANAWHTLRHKKAAMGIDWMNAKELSESIPPAYSEYIGKWALNHIVSNA